MRLNIHSAFLPKGRTGPAAVPSPAVGLKGHRRPTGPSRPHRQALNRLSAKNRYRPGPGQGRSIKAPRRASERHHPVAAAW